MRAYPLDASLTLAEAAPKWFEEHKRHIMPNTIRNYTVCLKRLTEFMGGTALEDIGITQIRAYQAERVKKAGSYVINEELSVLQMILKESGQWKQVAEFYKPMRVPKRRAGHSLDQEQEQRLREVAFSQPKWRLAANCMTVMLSTTMGFGELRHVRRRDVDMKKRSIVVRDGAKNLYRDRTIPLNTAAYEAMSWLIERWSDLGGSRDEDFILPHRPRRNKGPWIFTEPMSSIATAFARIRKAAGLPQFRIYDCRVQAITKLLSNPMVSPQVSREIAGHVSQVMQSHYSIQQFDTKKAALEALENPGASPTPPSQSADGSPIPAAITPPVKSAATMAPAGPDLQAEIDRRVNQALEAYFAAHPPADTQHLKRRTRKGADDSSRGGVVYRQRPTPKVIAFPDRSA